MSTQDFYTETRIWRVTYTDGGWVGAQLDAIQIVRDAIQAKQHWFMQKCNQDLEPLCDGVQGEGIKIEAGGCETCLASVRIFLPANLQFLTSDVANNSRQDPVEFLAD